MASLTSDDTRHIALLANLTLSDDQITHFTPQLSSVLDYTQKIQSLDTSSVEETSQVTGLENVFREDEVDENRILSQSQALSGGHHTHNGYFVVPAVLKNK